MINKQRISFLQQALWKLQSAKDLIVLAVGEAGMNDCVMELLTDITEVMENIEADIAEEWVSQ